MPVFRNVHIEKLPIGFLLVGMHRHLIPVKQKDNVSKDLDVLIQ